MLSASQDWRDLLVGLLLVGPHIEQGETMTSKDKASLVISVFALCLSSLSLYFTQIRTSYTVEAVVLEADTLGGQLSYQIAIFNQGTHRVI